MLRFVPGLVVIALLTTVLAGSTWGASQPTVFLVGYKQGDERNAQLAIQAAGGTVKRSSPELAFSVVWTDQPGTFVAVASSSPYIQYVENEKPTSLSGAQWNGAQWNGAQWNGAQWNGAQWNGAQWNGAQWNNNGGTTNDVQLQAAQWTQQSFAQNKPSGWKYETAISDPGLSWQWDAWATRAVGAWQTTLGTRSATLCVLDSGVAWDHPDLAPNMWTDPLGSHGWNAQDPTASAYDDAGHGTHIAGIAAAATGNAYGVAGVANERITAVKVLDSTGHGEESDLAFGLVWCANHGAKVAVMALSITDTGPTLDRALQYSADHDVLMLASAGNAGPCTDCVAYPARDARVLGVEAVDGDLHLANFSSRGTGAELSAPGVDILGPFPGSSFVFGSGTSQAVAYAAGSAALVRDVKPGLTATQAGAVLVGAARDIGVGVPFVDVNAAIR